jgi:hypothetical protein
VYIRTYSDGGANNWLFGNNGSLTLPIGGIITDSVETVTISGAGTSAVNQTYGKVSSGQYIGQTDNAYQIDPPYEPDFNYKLRGASAGGFYESEDLVTWTIVAGEGGGTAPVPTGVIVPQRITVTVDSSSWQFGEDGSLTFPDATVQTTAYPGIATVAKTGATIPTTTGPINNFDISPQDGSGGLTNGTYGPLTVGTVTFFVLVENDRPYVNYIQTQPILTIGDTIGTIDSGDLGGTPGTTFTLTVSNVVQETPTAIDLTKSINKLTNGTYSLANGVEGQIMYLVRQTGVNWLPNVTVANARIDGVIQTAIPFSPFTDGTDPTNMATLIFTDSAWQNMGGYWNLT